MDDARLTQILEETISMFGSQFLEHISQPITDLSNSLLPNSSSLPNTSSLHNSSLYPPLLNTDPIAFDISNVAQLSTEQIINLRKYQLLENIAAGWFRNTRDYQDITHQMNTISEQLIQTVTNINESVNINNNNNNNTSSRTNLFNRQNTPFLLEVGGFTLPMRRTTPPPAVAAYPNIQQVMNATEIYLYDNTSSTTTDLSCPITLEEFVPGEELCRIQHCRHVFTWRYLQEWFCTNSHCPVCRYDIRTVVPPTQI